MCNIVLRSNYGYGMVRFKRRTLREIYHGSNVCGEKPKVLSNRYDYTEDDTLNTCRFKEMTEEWLNFIVDCRSGIEHTFWVLVKFKYPNHQIVFCTEKAIGTMQYERSYSV